MKQQFWLGCMAAVLTVTSANAEVIWRGDFETGNLSQWNKADSPYPSERLVVVDAPGGPSGSKALSVTVKPGDYASSGNRAELVHLPMVNEGEERWYRWRTMWPQDYQSPNTWQLFMQWHHTGCCGNPPLSFYVYGEEVRLITATAGEQIHKLASLSRGVWHDFVFHVMWSSDRTVGFVEVWYDGELVLPKTHVATLYAGEQNYMKMGLYRNSSITFPQTLFHDEVIEATAASDVAPSTPTPPSNPDPDPDQPAPTPDPGVPTSPAEPPITLEPVAPGSPVEPPLADARGQVGCGRADIAGGGGVAFALIALWGAAARRRRGR